MVFHPLLAEVAGGSLNPDSVCAPLRQMLPGVQCRTEEVTRIDPAESRIEFESDQGGSEDISYDHLVIACGAVVNLTMVPGMADHAFPLKTIGDALAVRSHVMQQLEKAEVCSDPERKRWYLSFVIIGGGYSGVETAGEINDLVRGSLRYYSNISVQDLSVVLVHSRSQVLPEISSDLREFAREKMGEAGINVMLNERAVVATPEGVRLKSGGMIRGGTLICTIGTQMSPVIEKLNTPKERGRLIADPDMRLQGQARIWASGDCAWIINDFDGHVSAPTGQFAERQGKQIAHNIRRVLHGEQTQPFYHKALGQLCSIGGHTAVAEMMGLRLSGFWAWFVWRGVYLMKLPSWSRRTKVGFDWAWQVVFQRDLTHLRTDQTERVSHAFYEPGDYIILQGDPGTTFYIIEKGKVEVVRRDPDSNKDEVLAELGAGDFFGEMALIDNRPRAAGVRALSSVEVVVIGRTVFDRISSSLKPMKDIIAEAVRERTASLYKSEKTAVKRSRKKR